MAKQKLRVPGESDQTAAEKVKADATVEDVVATKATGEWLDRTSAEAHEHWLSMSEAQKEKPFTVLCKDGWYVAPYRPRQPPPRPDRPTQSG